jgi:hypothetical protein
MPTFSNNVEEIESIQAKKMIGRLEEIKKIDKSDISRVEKIIAERSLRN